MLSSVQVLKESNKQSTKSDLQLQTGFFLWTSPAQKRIRLFDKSLFGLAPEPGKQKLET